MPFDANAIGKTLKKIPWWGYAGGGGVVLALVYFIRKDMTSSTTGPGTQPTSSTSTDTSATDQGLQMADLAGMPYDTFDSSYNSDPYYDGSNPSGYNPVTSPPSGSPPLAENPIIKNPGPGPAPTPAPGTPVATPPIIQQPAPTPPGTPPTNHPVPPQAPPTQGQTYWHEVHAWPAWDSTLSGIAGHYGMSWSQLYDFGNDKQIIDNAAHAHGHYSQEYNWLFPGEELQVPSGG